MSNELYADLLRVNPTIRPLNLRPSLHDCRVPAFGSMSFAFPFSVDLRDKCSGIMDQGQMGSCSGNALAGAVEFLELQQLRQQGMQPQEYSANFERVSRLFIYWNERAVEGNPQVDAGCTTLLDGCTALIVKGACREATWAYDEANLLKCPTHASYAEAYQHKVKAFYRINDLNGMRQCLAQGFPFTCGIPVYDSFMSAEVGMTGQVPLPSFTERLLGGHALLVVGYDGADHFIVRNSWGAGWGDKGYCYLPYSYLTMYGSDFFTLRLS